jgi:hypothetical protein
MRRFIKKTITMAFIALLFITLNINYAYAEYQAQNESKAIALQTLGLIKGGDKGLELERASTRLECSVMLVRLLGKEAEAQNMHYSHPFKDVPEWGKDYVGYLYENGLTNGIGNGLFGSDQMIDSKSYATMLLRALGYDDKAGDFSWDKSLEKSKDIGIITEAEYTLLNGKKIFLRDDLMGMSYGCLKVNLKNSETSLISRLVEEGTVNTDTAVQLNLYTSTKIKTKVTLFDFDGTYHYIKVDYATLPESMKNFNQISVSGGCEVSLAGAAVADQRAREGKDNLNSHTPQGSNGSFGSYGDGSTIYLFRNNELVGYGIYKGKVDSGTVEIEFKEFKGFEFDAVKIDNSCISFNSNNLLLIDRSKMPENVRDFTNITLLNLALRGDTPVESAIDIAAFLEYSKSYYDQQQFQYNDSGFDTSKYKDFFFWDKCYLYFLDSSNNCLGYYQLTPEEVYKANLRI